MSSSAMTQGSALVHARWRRVVAGVSPAVGRSKLEWLTDSVLFTIAVAVWIETVLPVNSPQLPDWWRPFDLVLGAIAVASIWWTRRYPLLIGILILLPGATASSATVGILVAVYRMGLLASVRPAIVLTALHIATALPYHALLPLPGLPWTVWVIVIPLLYTLSLCIGLLGRARRQLLAGLRETAARDRERYEERLATIRREERQQIAREMHDVLAHRISLLSMHAGALELRATSAAPPQGSELREAAQTIRTNAHSAVEDLRELLGLLRSDDELGTGIPQARLAQLPALITTATAAGQRVEFASDTQLDRVKDVTQRTAYRVVQEALTNARKHAPHAHVHVQLRHTPELLAISVVNAVPPGFTQSDLPPPGNGLLGLNERVRLVGGKVSATVEDGEFRLRAELPTGKT